jgi:carboxymethylenebutenolidase
MCKVSIVLIAFLLAYSAAAQDWARVKLEKSPRHQEWVKVKQGDREVETFVVFPEVKEKATAVVVIHENRGLTDWVRGVADQLAEAGYVAIAPDLLSGMAPRGGKTSDFPNEDAAMKGIYALPPDQVTADLRAVADYAAKIPAANGQVVVAGFCWGGSQTFRFASNAKDIKAAFVFYGTAPEDQAAIARIQCPVYGFYGGSDARVDATIPKTTEMMKKAGKEYEPVTYEGAGHGFMRSGEDPDGQAANKHARTAAWQRWLALLKRQTG